MTSPAVSVRIGDIVEVPAGADDVCTTRYRIQVDSVSASFVSGPRLRADGTPMRSRSVESTDGLMHRDVPRELLPRCIVHRYPQREA